MPLLKKHQTVWNSSLVYSWNKSAGKVMMWPTLTCCFETWWICEIVPEAWKRRRGKMQAPHPKLCIDTSSASTCYRRHSYSSQKCYQCEENQAAAIFMREPSPSSCFRAGQRECFWQRFVLHIWETFTGFAPHLSKLSSSLAGFCMTLLPFYFKGCALFSTVMDAESNTIPSSLQTRSIQLKAVSCTLTPSVLIFHEM